MIFRIVSSLTLRMGQQFTSSTLISKYLLCYVDEEFKVPFLVMLPYCDNSGE